MKKVLKSILLFAVLVSLTACNGENFENLSNAANEIATLYGTEDVNVGTTFTRSTGGTNIDAYTIKIANIKAVEEDDYPKLYVASTAASIMYDELTPEQRKEHNTIKVTIASKSGDESFEYTMDELKKVDGFFKTAVAYAKKIKEKKYDELYTYFDQQGIPHDVFYNDIVNKVFIPDEALLSTMDKYGPQGFEFLEIEGKKMVKTYIAAATKEGKTFLISITFTNDKAKKVTGFTITGQFT